MASVNKVILVGNMNDDVAVCPQCSGMALQSQMDETDPYWYCVEEQCHWTGYLSTPAPFLQEAELT